jgi:hypothetical protein
MGASASGALLKHYIVGNNILRVNAPNLFFVKLVPMWKARR